MNKDLNVNLQPSLSGLLFIVFLVLKLVPGNPVNGWSWWAVTAPLWVPIILAIIILIVISIVIILKESFSGK